MRAQGLMGCSVGGSIMLYYCNGSGQQQLLITLVIVAHESPHNDNKIKKK